MKKISYVVAIGLLCVCFCACGKEEIVEQPVSQETMQNEMSIEDYEAKMDALGWDYQYLKSDATITVKSESEIDEALAREIIDSEIYGYVSSVGITFRWGEGMDSQSYTVSGKNNDR